MPPGERLIISQVAARKNSISLARGAAASSSLPGVIGPTLLGQRYGMDGAICSNAAHVDVVAGSKRAIVITITDGLTRHSTLACRIATLTTSSSLRRRVRRSFGSSPIRRPTSAFSIPSRFTPHCTAVTSARERKRPKSRRFGLSANETVPRKARAGTRCNTGS